MADEDIPPDGGNAGRPRKMPRVDQNHDVTITHINDTTMEIHCDIQVFADHRNPEGFIKRGIRLNVHEFSKGAKILSERCGYFLLTPLSTHSYMAYLNKKTQEFLRNGDRGGTTKPVVQVYNQNPFKYSQKYYVATNSKDYGIQVFQLCSPTPKDPNRNENTGPRSSGSPTPNNPIGKENKGPGNPTSPRPGTSGSPTLDKAVEGTRIDQESDLNNFVVERDSDDSRENQDVDAGYARWIPLEDLPFIVNWTGPLFKSMVVDDTAVQKALVNIIAGLDDVHQVKGLGFCVLSEFGRVHLYNCLADSDEGQQEEDEDDEDDDVVPDFRGFKQMLLILHSFENETGKSTLAEIFVRILRRKKEGIYATVSFDSARKEFGKGEAILIDDYTNDEVGRVMLTRSSKSIWGKAKIIMQKETTIPLASMVICSNEKITDLKVEGVNKQETYRKLSVIDLGETPIRSDVEDKEAKFKKFVVLANTINKHFPSYCGLMLRNCGRYITPAEFANFKDITNHERMANILNNAVRLHSTLGNFCDEEKMEKPQSLKEPPNLNCLINKSELVQKLKLPDQVVRFLIERKEKIITAKNPGKEIGIAFPKSVVKNYPWSKESFSMVDNDGSKIYLPMRTRRLDTKARNATSAYFLKIEHIGETAQSNILEYLNKDRFDSEYETESGDEEGGDGEKNMSKTVKTPEEMVMDFFKKQADSLQKLRMSDFELAKQYVLSLEPQVHKCNQCGKICKSSSGVKQHLRACPKNSGNGSKNKVKGGDNKKVGFESKTKDDKKNK